jgi:DNA-binding transcriptional LysR family regulator
MLDPRRLLTFREVARLRSFSRAAAALSLTQPAVSQQIRALETQLGERLIERGRAGFALTSAGEVLYAHAEALAERLELAGADVVEVSPGYDGPGQQTALAAANVAFDLLALRALATRGDRRA